MQRATEVDVYPNCVRGGGQIKAEITKADVTERFAGTEAAQSCDGSLPIISSSKVKPGTKDEMKTRDTDPKPS